jgi:putative endonuclease
VTGRRQVLGRRGEDAAVQWYCDRGYQVLSRNWRCREGEIDLVVMDPEGDTVVICEVKTRLTDRFGSPFEAVTASKQRRLRQLAGRWLAQPRPPGSMRPAVVRFDVVAVTGDGHGALAVEVMQGAFG